MNTEEQKDPNVLEIASEDYTRVVERLTREGRMLAGIEFIGKNGCRRVRLTLVPRKKGQK